LVALAASAACLGLFVADLFQPLWQPLDRLLASILAAAALGALAGQLLAPLRRRLIGKKRLEQAAHRRARDIFLEKEVFKTDKRPAQFYLNQEHCLHCGLCVDPCPTGSIHHSHEYEMVVYNFDDLLFDKETLPYDLDQKQYRWNVLGNVPVKR